MAIKVMILTLAIVTVVCLAFEEAQINTLTTTMQAFSTQHLYYTKSELNNLILRAYYDKNKRENTLAERVRALEERSSGNSSLNDYAHQMSGRIDTLSQQIKQQHDTIDALREEVAILRATKPE